MSKSSELFWNRIVYFIAFGFAAAAVIYFVTAEQERPEDQADAPASIEDGGAQSVQAPTAALPGGTDSAAGATTPDTGAGPANGQPETAQSDQAQTATGDESGDGFVPIPIPSELAIELERSDGLREFHEMLEREPRDDAWATPIERTLSDFIAETFDLSELIVHLIECRSKSCEILAVGYGDDAFRNWIAGMSELFETDRLGDWGRGEYGASCGGGDLGPAIFALNCTFTPVEPAPENTPAPELLSLDAPFPEGVTVQRISVPEILVPVIESKPEVYDLHRRLEAESDDIGWSDFVESQIIEHFAGLPELESATVLGVECRTTLCEVQMMLSDPAAFPDWLAEMMEFHDETWHDLGTIDLNGDEIGEDRMGIVWLLERQTGR